MHRYDGVLNQNDGFELGRGVDTDTHMHGYVDSVMVTKEARYVSEFTPNMGCGFLTQIRNKGSCYD